MIFFHFGTSLVADRTTFSNTYLKKKTNFSNAEANKISYFHSNYRSDGASTSEARRIRRRSISITPEIGDDIVRLMLVSLFF